MAYYAHEQEDAAAVGEVSAEVRLPVLPEAQHPEQQAQKHQRNGDQGQRADHDAKCIPVVCVCVCGDGGYAKQIWFSDKI